MVFEASPALSLVGGQGSYGITVNSPEMVVAGQFSDNGSVATIAVGGSGLLSLTAGGGSVTTGTNFQVNGNLLACSPAALQGAAINLNNGGTLFLGATAATAAYHLYQRHHPLGLPGRRARSLPATG